MSVIFDFTNTLHTSNGNSLFNCCCLEGGKIGLTLSDDVQRSSFLRPADGSGESLSSLAVSIKSQELKLQIEGDYSLTRTFVSRVK